MADADSHEGFARIPSTLVELAATGLDPAMLRTALAPDEALATSASAVLGEPARTTAAGRYEHVAPLGEGGMGLVERVRDRDLLRDVAVKHLRPELLRDARMLDQFLWEARVTAYLDHPNIVPVHDLGMTPAGELFFTMKLVRGVTLEAAIAGAREAADGERGLMRRLRMFLQLCNAVAFAHARGVLHRDLKPANVMVGEFGEILVSDWGLALPLAGEAGDVLRRAMPEGLALKSAGTPMYMSPEQTRGDALDARSDAYTLGVILYELVALRPPYDATTVPEVLRKVASGAVVPLAEASPGASTSVVAVVEKAMAPAAADRYADVPALCADVEALLDGLTPAAESISLGRRAARYYVARDPAMAQLRVVDIDLWACSAAIAGAGAAELFARWIAPATWIGVTLLVIAGLVSTPPTLRWLRLRRLGRRR